MHHILIKISGDITRNLFIRAVSRASTASGGGSFFSRWLPCRFWVTLHIKKLREERKMKAYISCGIKGLVMMLVLLAGNPAVASHEGGSAGGEKTLFTKHFQNTLFDITEHAAYSVEILLDDKEYKIGKDVVGIVVHDAHDGDVIGAELTFVLKDLVVVKNSALKPTVKDKGNGLYIVSGLDLHKEGNWELAITVKKGRIEDRVKFLLPDAFKALLPKGRYSP